jgi:hypothetical protein
MMLYTFCLLLAACIISLHNRKITALVKPRVHGELVCFLEAEQWRRKPCSEGVAIYGTGCLPQIPRRGVRKALLK